MNSFSVLHHRYCGRVLNPLNGATVNVPVCGKEILKKMGKSQLSYNSCELMNILVYNKIFTDATPPFIVRIYTDASSEEVTDPVFLNRGNDYKYIL